MNRTHYTTYVGIDAGTHTGIAVWEKTSRRLSLQTLPIHKAMELIKHLHEEAGDHLFVRFEDARLRQWFGKAGRDQLQGAGSIKRDSAIWDDYLKDLGVAYQAVAPKQNRTKLSATQFKAITKYTQKTNEHSRDAAMLVFGL